MESIWRKTVDLHGHPALSEDLKVEAAVLGGGLAGVLTAYYLQQKGVETVVLEADRVGSGQTQNTTAKITSQHNLIYAGLTESLGEEKAAQYAEANGHAVEEYRRLVKKEEIACDFEVCPAYLYSTGQQGIAALEKEAAAANRLGIHAEAVSQTGLPFPVAGAVKFHEQAQFHPLKFLGAISERLTIFEGTRALKVEGNRIVTPNGTVTAKHIVFATHFPFTNVPGFYFSRMHQERSYLLALEGVPELDGMYLGAGEEGLSFRSFANTLLLGGGGHRTGENSTGGKYASLREAAARYYPESREIAHWSAQDCMTLDGVPYIGAFASSTPHWYVATGFGKWGMTSSMVSAQLLSDQIVGVENPCAEVFSPLRFTPSASAKAFFSNMGQAVKGIARQALDFPEVDAEALPAGHGGVVECCGEKVGVYKDEQGRVFAVSVRCPHLGCQLEWNPDEKSWDCPCHGSRFDVKGTLLDGPAQEDLEVYRV